MNAPTCNLTAQDTLGRFDSMTRDELIQTILDLELVVRTLEAENFRLLTKRKRKAKSLTAIYNHEARMVRCPYCGQDCDVSFGPPPAICPNCEKLYQQKAPTQWVAVEKEGDEYGSVTIRHGK